MFLSAARALADAVQQDDLDHGSVYPALRSIREVSLEIAVAVAEEAYREGLARLPRPASLRQHLADQMYDPTY